MNHYADLMAIRIGAVVGWCAMIGANIAQGLPVITIMITAVLGAALVWGALALAAGETRRRHKIGTERVPRQEPWTVVIWGVIVITVVMALLALTQLAIAASVPGRADYWLLGIACASAATCGVGATIMLRRARTEYRDYHDRFK